MNERWVERVAAGTKRNTRVRASGPQGAESGLLTTSKGTLTSASFRGSGHQGRSIGGLHVSGSCYKDK